MREEVEHEVRGAYECGNRIMLSIACLLRMCDVCVRAHLAMRCLGIEFW